MTAELGRPIEAVIRHGKIEPVEPLDLPDEMRVEVTITRTEPEERAEEERARFLRALQQAGLVETIPDANAVPSWKLHPPAEIPGEPLSDIIIRMRDPGAEW
jgi:hypothetical protein